MPTDEYIIDESKRIGSRFLLDHGVTTVIYTHMNDVNEWTSQVIHLSDSSGKTPTLCDPFPLPPDQFQSLLKRAHPYALLTGDQSLMEAIFLNKCVIYQVMHWKVKLSECLIETLQKACSQDSLYYQCILTGIRDPAELPALLAARWGGDSLRDIQENAEKLKRYIEQHKDFKRGIMPLIDHYLLESAQSVEDHQGMTLPTFFTPTSVSRVQTSETPVSEEGVKKTHRKLP